VWLLLLGLAYPPDEVAAGGDSESIKSSKGFAEAADLILVGKVATLLAQIPNLPELRIKLSALVDEYKGG
jgi:hypothetical protein